MLMKRSNNLIVAVILILSIGVGLFLGKSFSPSKSDVLGKLFAYPDGSLCKMPCLLGIQPGLTTPEQALVLIQEHTYTKGNEIQQSQYSGEDYLKVPLQENSLEVRLDYTTNQVLEVDLISDGINGLGFIGINIDGISIKWDDIQKRLGQPEMITVVAGDGGIIALTAGLYEEGWCIEAGSDPQAIPLDSNVIRIRINCYHLKDLESLK
jgi:hypothetical protein